jgi:hypothetical protein
LVGLIIFSGVDSGYLAVVCNSNEDATREWEKLSESGLQNFSRYTAFLIGLLNYAGKNAY